MTKGEELKNKLGLRKLDNVRIARIMIQTGRPTYYVWYDTRRPTMPITTHRVKNPPYVSLIWDGRRGFNSLPKILPLQDIEDWSGNIDNSLFITCDLSGKYYVEDSMLESQSSTLEKSFNFKLDEFTTIADLKKNAISDRNKYWFKLRQKDGATGSKFHRAQWREDTDTILVEFYITPTYLKQVDTYSPTLKKRTSNHYVIQIEFLDASDILGTRDNFIKQTKGMQQKLIRQLLKEGMVRVWENDPSFYWQGTFETLSKVQGTIYPYQGPAGKGIWNTKHTGDAEGIHLTKHFIELLRALPFNAPEIAKYLREEDE